MLVRERTDKPKSTEIESSWIDIIEPEAPSLPHEKLALLHECLGVLALDGRVQGVTPSHVGSEGMYLINQALKAQARKHEV